MARTPTPERLRELAAELGETPAQVAGTLLTELERALTELDAGLAAGDHERVGHESHAARNSVLMLDERPMLAALRALDDAMRRGDPAGAHAARDELSGLWRELAVVLRAV